MDKLISEVDIVIVGQDPGNPRYADCYAFSYSNLQVNESAESDESCSCLKIFKELRATDEAFHMPKMCDLLEWSKNGVLLMNSVLTAAYKNERDKDK